MPIHNTQTNRLLAKHIRSLVQSLFTVSNTKDFNTAIFEPSKWFITMPLNAITLLGLNIGKAVNTYYDIRLQVGTTNDIILHRYSYPNPAIKRHYNKVSIIAPKTSNTNVLKQFNRLFRTVKE